MDEVLRLKPDLYDDGNPPSLMGGVCACGYVFFPMQRYGCEVCGRHGDDLREMSLIGRGRLVAKATVHLHSPDRPTPFTVGVISLDQGPVVRTLIDPADEGLAPGSAMVAHLVAVDSGDAASPRLDLRFMRAS